MAQSLNIIKNKLEELMKYVIEELLYWDTDIDKDVLEETFFEFLYGPKDLKGMDVFVFGLTLIEWSDAIENEFCIIRGSNIKNIVHNNERFFPKNFLAKKKIGITVINEKNVDANL